jgi:hypothetical protein
LLKHFFVGARQRPKNKDWRGFAGSGSGYNEVPTKQLPYDFCWKARPRDAPFFMRVKACKSAATALFFSRAMSLREAPFLHA